MLDRDARMVEYYASLPGNGDDTAYDSILKSISFDASAAPWGFLENQPLYSSMAGTTGSIF